MRERRWLGIQFKPARLQWWENMSNGRHEARIQDPNPERGLRGDFLKITVTVPAKMLGELKILGLRRRAGGRKDTDVSSLIREAVAELLQYEA